jgi:hypothetical protein
MSHNPAVSEWDNDYARVARVASQLRTQGLAASLVSVDPQQLQQHISRLDSALATLPLSSVEIQRRRRLIQHLSMNNNNTPSNSQFGTPGSDASSLSGGQRQQQSHIAQAYRQQEDMIDELAVGVSRLKDQTQVIGDEARMHVNLLGEMETNLEAAHTGLDAETKRAAKLKEDQSVWRLQLIVAGESILFILLLFLGLSP